MKFSCAIRPRYCTKFVADEFLHSLGRKPPLVQLIKVVLLVVEGLLKWSSSSVHCNDH